MIAEIDWSRLLQPETLIFLVALTAIVVGGLVGGIAAVLRLTHRHRERIEMIRNGMHPDDFEAEPPEQEQATEENRDASRTKVTLGSAT